MRGEPRVLASPTSVIANEVKRLLRKQPTHTCKSIIKHKEILTTASLRESQRDSWQSIILYKEGSAITIT